MIGILLNEKQQKELESLLNKEIKSLSVSQYGKKHRPIVERGLWEKQEILYSLLRLIRQKEKNKKDIDSKR
ncbi:hypothetical protein [Priestia abyssalis]|uniref:hypothetical protein n=1 Tax=Priestia abyssalis TaxID=1221450 RepID=UPI0009958CFF|nr:hypothetical protein [Priestia abyssalis]